MGAVKVPSISQCPTALHQRAHSSTNSVGDHPSWSSTLLSEFMGRSHSGLHKEVPQTFSLGNTETKEPIRGDEQTENSYCPIKMLAYLSIPFIVHDCSVTQFCPNFL